MKFRGQSLMRRTANAQPSAAINTQSSSSEEDQSVKTPKLKWWKKVFKQVSKNPKKKKNIQSQSASDESLSSEDAVDFTFIESPTQTELEVFKGPTDRHSMPTAIVSESLPMQIVVGTITTWLTVVQMSGTDRLTTVFMCKTLDDQLLPWWNTAEFHWNSDTFESPMDLNNFLLAINMPNRLAIKQVTPELTETDANVTAAESVFKVPTGTPLRRQISTESQAEQLKKKEMVKAKWNANKFQMRLSPLHLDHFDSQSPQLYHKQMVKAVEQWEQLQRDFQSFLQTP